jgi:CheY-like chemotaxis protein/anti-sigma regulatory factor (Ser/Thr protein kinase)
MVGDQARLTQVVANLLNNAATYQNEGGQIDLIASERENDALITVRDQGIGIAPEALADLFELFSQGERSPDSLHGGLGIGLSLVKTLVEMHGGTVSAASEGPGRGSEFVVRLPCAPAEPGRLEENGFSSSAMLEGPPRRILVVDDSRDAAETLALLLTLSGHEVLVAHDGPGALALAVAERPTVVLLDIGLPGMDGYEVCRRAREQGLRDTTIIAMSGYGQDRDRQRSSEAGFDGHTVKPVAISELTALLAKASLHSRS